MVKSWEKALLRALQVKEAEGVWMAKMGAARTAQVRALFSLQTLLQRGSQQQIQGWSHHAVTSGCEASPDRWCTGCVAEGGGDSLHWAAVNLRVTVWMGEVEFLQVLQFHGVQRTARTGKPGQGRTGNLSCRNLPNPFVSATPDLKQGQCCATLQVAAESGLKT